MDSNNLLWFLLLLFFIQLHYRSFAGNGNHLIDAEFHRLLDDKFHLITLWQTLKQVYFTFKLVTHFIDKSYLKSYSILKKFFYFTAVIVGVLVAYKYFIALFHNSAFKTALTNTFTFSAVAVPLAVILAMALAALLESRIPLKSQFRTFFLSPMMVPVASVVLIWQVIFHYNGVLNDFLAIFGSAPIDWLKSDYSQLVVVALFL